MRTRHQSSAVSVADGGSWRHVSEPSSLCASSQQCVPPCMPPRVPAPPSLLPATHLRHAGDLLVGDATGHHQVEVGQVSVHVEGYAMRAAGQQGSAASGRNEPPCSKAQRLPTENVELQQCCLAAGSLQASTGMCSRAQAPGFYQHRPAAVPEGQKHTGRRQSCPRPYLMPWLMRTPTAPIFRSPTHTPVRPGTLPRACRPWLPATLTITSSRPST